MDTPTTVAGWITALVLGLLNALQLYRQRQDQSTVETTQHPALPGTSSQTDLDPIEGAEFSPEGQTRLLLQIVGQLDRIEKLVQEDRQDSADTLDRAVAHQTTLSYVRQGVDEIRSGSEVKEAIEDIKRMLADIEPAGQRGDSPPTALSYVRKKRDS